MPSIVTVVSRVNEKVSWMYDGRMYELEPLEEKAMALDVAEHGYNKTKFGLHMELGTWNRAIGIRELGHDIDEIPELPSEFSEVFDRKTDPEGVKVVEHKFGNPDLARSRPIDSAL